MAHGGAEVVAVVEGAQRAAGVAARHHRNVRQAALALLVARVEAERLVEPIDQIGTPPQQLVVDRHRADDAAGAAAPRGAQAEQADGVGEVAVVGDVTGGAVAAHERIGRVLAGVDHVAEQLALRILRARLAEVLADAPVDQGGARARPSAPPAARAPGGSRARAAARAPMPAIGGASVGSGKSARRTASRPRPRAATASAARSSSSICAGVSRTIQSSRRRHLRAPPRRRQPRAAARWKRARACALEVAHRLGAEAEVSSASGLRRRVRRFGEAPVI